LSDGAEIGNYKTDQKERRVLNTNINEIKQLIELAGEEAFFVGKADSSTIAEIEGQLGITLPDSYKWFLQEYGYGGISGFMIIGNGKSGIPAVIKYTNQWRQYGLPDKFIVIEDDGTDWIYCLDTSQIVNSECPVVDWSQDQGNGNTFFENFLDFFKSQIMFYSSMEQKS
jgi:hypothetical protein